MNSRSNKIIPCLLAATAAAWLTGCECMKRSGGTGGGITDNDVFPYEGGKVDHYPKYVIVPPSGPTPSEGFLTIPIGSFSSGNNGQACFPTSAGWNKFYVTFYFLGPNVNPPPNPNTYPNPDNLNSFTVDTIVTENGTTLDTGIALVNNLNPADKVCNDDSPNAINAKLSKATFSPTASGKKYRAGIFYKSTTAGGLSEVKIHWKYP